MPENIVERQDVGVAEPAAQMADELRGEAQQHLVSAPPVISSAASTKNGTAISGKLSMPENISFTMTSSG